MLPHELAARMPEAWLSKLLAYQRERLLPLHQVVYQLAQLSAQLDAARGVPGPALGDYVLRFEAPPEAPPGGDNGEEDDLQAARSYFRFRPVNAAPPED